MKPEKLSKGRSALNDFRERDLVFVQDLMTKKWNIPGTIKQARISEDDTARSFIIERDDGSSLLRNAKYIKHQWKSPRTRKHVSWADVSEDNADDGTEQQAAPAL